VDELRRLTRATGAVENATGILIDAADGLRVINEVEQLAAFEYASCQTSDGIRRLLFGLAPAIAGGLTEAEAVRLLRWNGMPLSCHLMLSAGPRASLGMLSPGDRRIERGDRFTAASVCGARSPAGPASSVAGPEELSPSIGDYVGRLVGPYFEAITEWYGALHVGQTGGALQQIIDPFRIGDPFFGVSPSNPGQPNPQRRVGELAYLPRIADRTEVGHGPSGRRSSRQRVPTTSRPISRMGWPCRPVAARHFRANFPDGLEPHTGSTPIHGRCARIVLHPDVLPFSNIPAYLPPFLLRPDMAMTVAGVKASHESIRGGRSEFHGGSSWPKAVRFPRGWLRR